MGTVGDPGDFFNMDLSPDEQHVAVSQGHAFPGARATVDLWRIDLARSGRDAVDRPSRLGVRPDWSTDGKWIAFNSTTDARG